MERSRVTRYLRIAVTALSLTACVMLVALWVRSYWCKYIISSDAAIGPDGIPVGSVLIISAYGDLHFRRFGESDISYCLENGWEFESQPTATLVDYKKSIGFQWLASSNNVFDMATIPYWFPVLVTATISAVPWICGFRRFSLRALLIAMTLVAVVLGIIAFKLNKPNWPIEQPPIDVGDFGTPFEVTQ